MTCPGCGFVNPQGFKFCGRCGTTLAHPPAPAEDVGTARTVFVDSADAGADAVASTAAPGPGPAPIPATPAPQPVSGAGPTAAGDGPPAAPSTPPPSPAATPGSTKAAKLVMLGPDGQPIGERVLAAGELLEVGRTCGPPWEDDAYLDPRHASLQITDDGVVVEDHGSLNGVFLKLHDRVEVQNGDQFRVGQELLLYEDLPEPTPTDDGTERMGSPNPGYWGRVTVLVDPDHPSLAHPIDGDGIMIGRENGDITFPTDGYVSGQHCQIVGDDTGVFMEDVGSSNGTYMRCRTGQLVPYGSLILIGQKLFQVELAG